MLSDTQGNQWQEKPFFEPFVIELKIHVVLHVSKSALIVAGVSLSLAFERRRAIWFHRSVLVHVLMF